MADNSNNGPKYPGAPGVARQGDENIGTGVEVNGIRTSEGGPANAAPGTGAPMPEAAIRAAKSGGTSAYDHQGHADALASPAEKVNAQNTVK